MAHSETALVTGCFLEMDARLDGLRASLAAAGLAATRTGRGAVLVTIGDGGRVYSICSPPFAAGVLEVAKLDDGGVFGHLVCVGDEEDVTAFLQRKAKAAKAGASQ